MNNSFFILPIVFFTAGLGLLGLRLLYLLLGFLFLCLYGFQHLLGLLRGNLLLCRGFLRLVFLRIVLRVGLLILRIFLLLTVLLFVLIIPLIALLVLLILLVFQLFLRIDPWLQGPRD